MQQPSTSIELPQFTSIAAVVLHIARSCAGWRALGSGEDFATSFSHTPRHTGDEFSLRATLIRAKILPVFHYVPSDIEYESQERYLTQAGLYLGVLTNGDEWHLFDFAVGREPLASFSLVELTQLLYDAPNGYIICNW